MKKNFLRFFGGASGLIIFFLCLLPYFSNQVRSSLRSFFKPFIPRLSQYYENDVDALNAKIKELEGRIAKQRVNEDFYYKLKGE